jgi:predicted site-specific integrase-resolvase
VKAYTTVQAAVKLDVSRDTLYRWMRANKVARSNVTKFGEFRLRLWTEKDLDDIRAWMDDHPHANRSRKLKKDKKSKV